MNTIERDYRGEDNNGFGTLLDIAQWMIENEIPLNATMIYAGCGSHNIAFQWEGKPKPVPDPFALSDPTPEEQEKGLV